MMLSTRILGAAVAAGLLLAMPAPAPAAAPPSMTQEKGGYTFTLKLLPAAPWTANGADTPHGAMRWLSGAQPVAVGSDRHPNYHLVVFVSENGAPVADGKVGIRYKGPGVPKTHWTRLRWIRLPVARMEVAGAGAKTIHYGNNVTLKLGYYLVEVTLDDKVQSRFLLDVR